MKVQRLFLFICCVLVVMSVATACSDDKKSAGSDKKTVEKTSGGVTQAAQSLVDGLLSADGRKVYQYLSRDCQSKISSQKLESQLKTARAYLSGFIGISFDDFAVTDIETQDVQENKKAQVRFTLSVTGKSREAIEKYMANNADTPGEEQTFPFDEPTQWFGFVYEDSSWRLSQCDEFLSSYGLIGG